MSFLKFSSKQVEIWALQTKSPKNQFYFFLKNNLSQLWPQYLNFSWIDFEKQHERIFQGL